MVNLSFEHISQDVVMATCKGNASVDELLSDYPFLNAKKDEVFTDIHSERRRYEVLSEYLLLHELFGNGVRLLHDERGCPSLSNGYNIGISHTKGLVAMLISKQKLVSLDVEYVNERVCRVVDKFLRPDEKAETTEEKLLHWCTKETLYKLYPEDMLGFNDIRILPFDRMENSGTLQAMNLKKNCRVEVTYHINDDFVITYCVLE